MAHETRKLNISAKIAPYPIDDKIRGREKHAKKPKKKQMDPPKKPVAAKWPDDLGSGIETESRVTHSEKWFNSGHNTVNKGINVFMPNM